MPQILVLHAKISGLIHMAHFITYDVNKLFFIDETFYYGCEVTILSDRIYVI